MGKGKRNRDQRKDQPPREPFPFASLMDGPVPTSPQIPGGCDACNSHQILRQVGKGITALSVYHDDDCPEYLRIQAGRR